MIIITGSVVGKPETIDELRALCLEHTRRSRLEPGCLSHDVHVDVEHPLRLFFFETWADRAAVDTHFAVPESGAFVRAASLLVAEAPSIAIWQNLTQVNGAYGAPRGLKARAPSLKSPRYIARATLVERTVLAVVGA